MGSKAFLAHGVVSILDVRDPALKDVSQDGPGILPWARSFISFLSSWSVQGRLGNGTFRCSTHRALHCLDERVGTACCTFTHSLPYRATAARSCSSSCLDHMMRRDISPALDVAEPSAADIQTLPSPRLNTDDQSSSAAFINSH